MASARDDVVQSLNQLATAAQDLAAGATELAAAIAEDPPQAAKIGRAMQTLLSSRLKATKTQVAVMDRALKRWVLLNPTFTHEKF